MYKVELRACVRCHCEKYRCNRGGEAIPEGLDCFAEFILSAAVGLAMTERRLLHALLEKEGLPQVPVYAVETSFTDRGIDYKYNFTYPGEPHRGNSKGLVVSRFRRQGYRVLYVGDGRSDFEAAVEADQVFAHSILAEECQRQGIPFRPFRDFGDVLSVLQEYAADGHSGP